MPLYTCIADSRTALTERARIGAAITEIHCRHTGAPPEFVHVIFNEYLGHSAKSRLRVVGTIRAGRTLEVKAEMHAELVAEVARAAAAPDHLVEVTLQEIPAGGAMEGGEVLPEPGSEGDWMSNKWSAS